MNIKPLLAPLTERINALASVLEELLDTTKEQLETQQKILLKLNDRDKENICKTEKIPD